MARQARIEHALFDIAADFLRADEPRPDLGIVHVRYVGTRSGRDGEPCLLHHREGRILQAALRQSEYDFLAVSHGWCLSVKGGG
jgi:hypothetical protein